MVKAKEVKIIKKKVANKKDEKIDSKVEETTVMEEKIEEKKFKIEGIDYVPYITGWILGVFNIIFWIILLIVGLATENKHRFVDYTLHKFVYIYGIVMIVLMLMAMFLIILLLMLGFSLFGPMMWYR